MSAFLARAPRRLRVVAALAVFLALATGATAQTETGRITGVVTDATGGILPGVTVTAKAVGTGATRELTTDSAGQYVFANLPPGAFEISAALAGFNTANAKVTVTVGGAVSVDLKLDVAGTKENVNVVAEVPRINVTNAEVSTTITEAADPRAANHHPQRLRPRRGRGQRLGRQGRRRRGMDRDDTRHRLQHQRPARLGHQHPARRLGQQQRVRHDGRPERPARFRPGIQRGHQQLLGAVRPGHRRRRQRPDQVGHEQLPRHRLRLLPHRQAGHQHLRQQGERDREGRVQAPSAGVQRRRADPPRQDALLHQSRIHPRAQRGHADQLGADAAVDRGERAGDQGLLCRLWRRRQRRRHRADSRRRVGNSQCHRYRGISVAARQPPGVRTRREVDAR